MISNPGPLPDANSLPNCGQIKPQPYRTSYARVIEDVKKPARPATRKALVATIRHLFRGIADEDVAATVNELTLRGAIAIERDKVGYPSA